MLRLFTSNRLEDLIAPLADSVRAQQARDPLEPVTIIVPGRVMEQYIKFELAERLGVAANLRFPFLGGYLAALVRGVDARLHVVERSELQLAIFEHLRAPGVLESGDLLPVRRYLESSASDPSRRDLRAFQFAGQIARVFHDYAFSRRGWFTGSEQAPLFPEVAGETAHWQRVLWRGLFDERGALRDRIAGGDRWMLLPDAFASVDLGAITLPRTLHVFGLPHVAPAVAGMLGRLGDRGDVIVHAASPCLEFREDAAAFGADSSRWVSREGMTGGDPLSGEDPFALDLPGGNRALRLWARPVREHIRLLHAAHGAEVAPLFEKVDPPPRTLLEAIRRDILLRAPERALVEDGEGRQDDGSVRFLACPGIRREVEVVASTIWSLIRRGEAAGGKGLLRFHEIAIVTPDRSFDAYLPHIETVFAGLHRIPVNPISRRLASESRLAEAVELLLRLPLSRFEREDMLRLLTHPAVGGAQPEVDVSLWRVWCDQLHVLFGADKGDFEGTYIEKDVYNWDQALRRLALGAFMAGERSGEEGVFAGSGDPCLPLEVPQGATTSAGRLLRTARGLIEDARACRGATLRLPEWAEVMARMVRTAITPADDRDRRILGRCLDAIGAMAEIETEIRPLPYAVAHEIVTQEITGIEAQRGALARNGVAVGPLSALRAVPFRMVFALGLEEGIFPARDREDPLDLRGSTREPGDVSPRERDRALFLDLLLAARERIFLSWVSRNAQTGDDLEPSTVVRELQLVLREHVSDTTIEGMTARHPVSRYEPVNFPGLGVGGIEGDRDFAGVDPEARRGARVTLLRRGLEQHVGAGRALPDGEAIRAGLAPPVRERIDEVLRIPTGLADSFASRGGDKPIDLSLSALRRFLECPLQGYARYSLGLLDDDPEEPDDHEEPVSQSHPDRTRLLRQALWEGGGDLGAASLAYRRLLDARELRGVAPTGAFARSEERLGRQILGAWLANIRKVSLPDLSKWRDLRLGQADEFADVDDLGEPLVLPVKLSRPGGGATQVSVRIHGTTERFSLEVPASLACVARKEAKDKDYLGQFLTFVALAAKGQEAGEAGFALHAVPVEDLDPGKWRRSFRSIPRGAAIAYLEALVTDLLSESHDYFLPVEAVYAAKRAIDAEGEKGPKDLREVVEGLRERESAGCSSDYGPVRNARDYEPPDEKTIRDILKRRFGPLLDGRIEEGS